MKRIIQLIGILMLVFILFSISGIATPGTGITPQAPDPSETTREPIDDSLFYEPEIRQAVIEYGAVNVLKNNGSLVRPLENNFHVFISYPQAGHLTDEIIRTWALELFAYLSYGFDSVLTGDPGAIGEANVQFDSFLVDNRYAGIDLRGWYTFILSPDSYDIAQTFNIDLSRMIFLETEDIFDLSQIDYVLALLSEALVARYPRTRDYLDNMDESWLRHSVIKSDGIGVTIKRGEFFPTDIPTISVTLPYRQLGQALLIRNQLPLLEMPPADPAFAPPVFVSEYEIPEVSPQRGVDATRPMVAITFDDGPSQYMDEILDLLEEFGVRATFSLIGNITHTQRDAIVRASIMGNEIIGHSWDHRNLAKLSSDDVRRQIVDTNDAIVAVTGVSPRFFRPPYGVVNETIRAVATDLELTIVNWSVDPEDWNTRDVEEIIDYVLMNVGDGDIILAHQMYRSTLDAFSVIIPELMSNGFQFVTVTELMQFSGVRIVPGEVIFSAN